MSRADPVASTRWSRLHRMVDVRPAEVSAVLWSWLFFFCVLSTYYVIRPIRDDMGLAGGVENLPWLFTGSLAGMLIAHPPFALLVARLPRPRFVSIAYRFFALNLLVFFFLLQLGSAPSEVWIGRLFFVWTSVFNMFVVSIFWSVMTDVFTSSQGARLFGFIGAGGTIGSIAGAALTSGFVGILGPGVLLIVSAVLLEVAAFAARRLFLVSHRDASAAPAFAGADNSLIGGSMWKGLGRAIFSPYFINITVHMLLFTVLTALLYLQQATLVDAAIMDRVARTRFFANIDLVVNGVTLVTQLFATGRLVRTFGLTASLVFLPALSLAGFLTLGMAPTIGVLVVFQILRRAGNFAIARPAREVLFTLVSREDRYKAKSFIDTFVYRAGDQMGAWSYAPLAVIGLGVAGISRVAAVIAAFGILNALWLGRKARNVSTELEPPAALEATADSA